MLAIMGGEPVLCTEKVEKLLKNKWPIIEEDDYEAMKKNIINRDLWSFDSDTVREFENEYAKYVGTKYAVACSSGTAALHVAIRSAGIGDGELVAVPSLTFIASAMAILQNNSIPIFVDVDKNTFNISARKLEKIASKTNLKAVVVVNLHGLPADYTEIKKICKKYNIIIIEDNSQAHGAEYEGMKTGSIGDIAAASVMPGKNLPSAGEGGIVTTNNYEFYKNALRMRNLGAMEDTIPVDCDFVTYNYHMTPVAAAMATTQLKKLDKFNDKRNENVDYFISALGKYDFIKMPKYDSKYKHTYSQFRIVVDTNNTKYKEIDSRRLRMIIFNALKAEGVPVANYQRVPLPYFPVFKQDLAEVKEECENAKEIIETSFTLHQYIFSPLTTKEEIDVVISAFKKILDEIETLIEYFKDKQTVSSLKDGLFLY